MQAPHAGENGGAVVSVTPPPDNAKETECLPAAPAWDRPPVWVHGDLGAQGAGNLLAVDGRLSAVIDFGTLGVGDPACELIVAWSLYEGAARDAFRAELSVDAATWARGRGWALSVALVALPYSQDTNPVIAAGSRNVIETVLADHAHGA